MTSFPISKATYFVFSADGASNPAKLCPGPGSVWFGERQLQGEVWGEGISDPKDCLGTSLLESLPFAFTNFSLNLQIVLSFRLHELYDSVYLSLLLKYR